MICSCIIESFRSKDGLCSYKIEWRNFAVLKTHPYIQIISSIRKNTYLVERYLRQAWTLKKAL